MQPLRGCGLRSTHSSASVWFVSLGRHLHGANLVSRFFALHAKRLLRNLCVGCPLRTPRERPMAFRPIACCLQNNDRFVPKPLRFKCLCILPLFCVLYARLLKGLRLFVGFACCHLRQSRLMAIATQLLPYRSNFGLLSPPHAEKMQALFRLCLLLPRFPSRGEANEGGDSLRVGRCGATQNDKWECEGCPRPTKRSRFA